MDKIKIEDLEVYAYHGVAPEEKALGQLFIVSVDIAVDLESAANNDDLSLTISYADVCTDVEQVLTSRKYDLIEAAAMAVVRCILDKYPLAMSVKVLLKKPWAPLKRHLKYAAVEIERNRNELSKKTAYIGIGSNMGDRQGNLDTAIEMLGKADGIEVSKVSPYYNTAPVGYTEQPDFLNTVVELKTTLTPHELLKECQKIENQLKRVRAIHWGPRTIDLDILLYDDVVLNEENLTIPHPRMHEREFVLKPLSQIALSAVHPVLNKTVSELYSNGHFSEN